MALFSALVILTLQHLGGNFDIRSIHLQVRIRRLKRTFDQDPLTSPIW
jgi:hypothetical protein